MLQGDTIVNATQAKWLRRSIMLCAALGVAKYWWYSFDNDVMWMTDEDITAWREVRAALIGGTFSGCNIAPTVGWRRPSTDNATCTSTAEMAAHPKRDPRDADSL